MSNALPSGLGEKPWTFAWILARKVNRLKDACCNFVHSTARKTGKNAQVPGGSERARIEFFYGIKIEGRVDIAGRSKTRPKSICTLQSSSQYRGAIRFRLSQQKIRMSLFAISFCNFFCNIAMRRFPYANNENPRRKISTIFEHDFLAVSSVPDAFVKFSQLRWAQKNRLQMEGESRGRPVKNCSVPDASVNKLRNGWRRRGRCCGASVGTTGSAPCRPSEER